MKKLLYLLWIVPCLIFGQGKTIAFQKNTMVFNGQASSYYLNTSATAQTKAGQLTVLDAIITNMATGATVTLASFTSTGQIDSTETSDASDITIDTLDVNYIVINSQIQVDGTINFAADGQGNDDYEISLPSVTALTTGMMVIFTATTANTDGATLEITEVGDLDAILKNHDVALVTGDIEAGQVVVCVFDGTSWQMTSQLAQ